MKRSDLRGWRILVRAALGAAGLIFACAMVFLIMQLSGKNSLAQENRGAVPLLSQSALTDGGIIDLNGWQEGDVRYQGVHYRYNKDIMTFLFLGIDKMEEVGPVEDQLDGGQSDAIFLLVLDPHKKEISVIGVNRDTMTDVDVYNWLGDYLNTVTLQLCLQHGYGDGAQVSCERSREAVSKLFYGLPINGYCAINMGAIPQINDAVGGVRLTALEDVPRTDIKEGDEVLLRGMDAYYYLHNRDTTKAESARRRLERQKQYISIYAETVMASVKANLTLPVGLYRIVDKYMVTDISVNEVSYLATQVADYHFDTDHIYTLEGETVMGERYEEFYPDERALYELILKIFYEEVE